MTRPLARTEDILSEEVSGECVLYDRRRKKAHNLNSTLTWIWQKCDGQSSIEEISAAFEQQFVVTNGLSTVLNGLKQLEACNLLESPIDVAEFAPATVPLSRRSVVAAGSVLFPALVSVLAPTPAAAKSKPDDGDDPHQRNKHDR
jgi:hypothetical protein